MIGMALFAVLMCVNLASCSDDEKEEEEVVIPEEFSIVGTWEMIAGDYDEWTIIFREDGTGKDYVNDGGYEDETDFTYSLELDKRKLTIKTGDSSTVWYIVKCSEKEATLRYTYSGGSVEYVFKKTN